MDGCQSIAGSRELSLSNGGKVMISLGMPTLLKEGDSSYRCWYQISGLNEEESGRVVGGDALQSLQLALIKVGAILYTCPEWRNNLLSWNGDRDLGFPLPESLRDLQP
ncbi:hypothetical protein HSX11_01435 [Oxalobacteraceae bacterium]|nr:hypothetical protein [Oxalobacteraceae bacterium]